MKRLYALLFIFSLLFTLSACGQTANNVQNPTENTQESLAPMDTSHLDETEREVSNTEVSPSEQIQYNSKNFNFETRTVTLNSGYEMPIYGLGTYSLHDEECKNSVTAALNSGVRLIDTAHAYGNEAEIGEAIRDSGIPREEIFVITKLYPDQFSDPDAAIEEALAKLNIGYIDMMLLHHPGDGDVEAYHAMENAVAEGKIHSIGLSN